MPRRTDEALLLAAGRGDREAFGLLVERQHRAVVQFIHRFLVTTDRATVEDLAQDVFLGAWKAATSYRPRAKVSTWLLRITTNVCLNYRRSRRLRRMIALDGDRVAECAGSQAERADVLAAANEEARGVRAAVASLPPSQRAAIVLRHFQGLSYAEISDVLDVSVSAVESLLFRARSTLRVTLGAKENRASPQVSAQWGAKTT